MGKPYASELRSLAQTNEWALATDISALADAVKTGLDTPLIAVGSGGSLSSAWHAADLHEARTGLLSKAVTPLELVSGELDLTRHGLLFVSAGGANRDILGGLRYATVQEPRSCTVLCLRPGSPLSKLSARQSVTNLVEFRPPTAKDGFLATNSLAAFGLLLERAYGEETAGKGSIEQRLGSGLLQVEELIARVREEALRLWERDTILLLYTPELRAAAVDFESKFAEAGLLPVLISDFRNFAHGRHQWLARHPQSTGVLAMYSAGSRALAEATLRLLPSDVAVARLSIPSAVGLATRVAALIAVLNLVGDAGSARDVDPGRPHVPEFGRRIYNLGPSHTAPTKRTLETVAVARKMRSAAARLLPDSALDLWRKAYRGFLERLEAATFGGLVLDYDGTLCDGEDRYRGLGTEAARTLQRIVDEGVSLGVATGRGRSVRDSLRATLRQERWGRVLVGYYNCSHTLSLTSEIAPSSVDADPELEHFASELRLNPIVAQLASIEFRPSQISVEPTSPMSSDIVWRTVAELTQRHPGLQVVRSSHAVDVLNRRFSKLALVTRIIQETRAEVLAIGDMGSWPGNDYALLSTPFSLSVADVSTSLESCWNLAPPGYRGPSATIRYLECLVYNGSRFRVDVTKLSRWT